MSIEIEKIKPNHNIFYFVKKNETIEQVALKFNISVLKLASIIKKDELTENDIIFLPECNRAIHVVKPLENLTKIASLYNVSAEYIKNKNNIEEVFIGQKIYI